MSKKEQVLILDPPTELRFKGPFTDVVTSSLKLTNPTDRRVYFKVKTTAPKRYCVRPNNGMVDGKSTVVVAVMLQPFDYDPNEKNKHKFMVQTMFAPDSDISSDSLWKDVSPENLMDSKLKCVFEMALDGTSQNNFDATLPMDEKSTTFKTMDTIKLSPKSQSADYDQKRGTDEMKRLEKENANMRQEMIQLKEEGLRLRRLHQSAATVSEPDKGSLSPTFQPFSSDVTSQTAMMTYLFIALIAFLLGFVFCKVF